MAWEKVEPKKTQELFSDDFNSALNINEWEATDNYTIENSLIKNAYYNATSGYWSYNIKRLKSVNLFPVEIYFKFYLIFDDTTYNAYLKMGDYDQFDVLRPRIDINFQNTTGLPAGKFNILCRVYDVNDNGILRGTLATVDKETWYILKCIFPLGNVGNTSQATIYLYDEIGNLINSLTFSFYTFPKSFTYWEIPGGWFQAWIDKYKETIRSDWNKVIPTAI